MSNMQFIILEGTFRSRNLFRLDRASNTKALGQIKSRNKNTRKLGEGIRDVETATLCARKTNDKMLHGCFFHQNIIEASIEM